MLTFLLFALFLILIILNIVHLLERLKTIESHLVLLSFGILPNLDSPIITFTNDIFELGINGDPLHKPRMLLQYPLIATLLDLPNDDPLIDPRRNQVFGVGTPLQVENLGHMSAKLILARPLLHLLLAAGRHEVLADLPDDYHFVVGPGRQVASVGGELYGVDVALVGLQAVPEGYHLGLAGCHLPNLGIAVLLAHLFGVELVGAASHELVGEGVEIDGEDSLLAAVPDDDWELHFHFKRQLVILNYEFIIRQEQYTETSNLTE